MPSKAAENARQVKRGLQERVTQSLENSPLAEIRSALDSEAGE